MRWFWIDRFVEFVSSQRAEAIKNVTLAELHVSDGFAARAILPASLVVEGLAQTGGILVAEAGDFEQRVVLAKISKADFVFDPRPGDRVHYHTTIEQLGDEGALVTGNAHIDDQICARAKLVFAYLGDEVEQDLFAPLELLQMLKLWCLFDVGRRPDGRPLTIPEKLRSATVYRVNNCSLNV